MTDHKPRWDSIFTIVINLPKDTDRLFYMEEQLRRFSIPYSILSATDGRTHEFGADYIEHIAIKKNGRPLTPPEKGCALSHRRALQALLDSGKEYGLIMEDDVALDTTFPEAIQLALSRKDVLDYVQFNYSPVGWKGAALWWFLFVHNKNFRTPLSVAVAIMKGVLMTAVNIAWGWRDVWHRTRHSGKLYNLYRDQYLAGCYLLTRETALTLIQLNTPLAYAADRVQNIARRSGTIKHRIYVPRIVRQRREAFRSSINNEHFGEKVISY